MLNKSCRSRHFEFHIRTKNVKFVEDHPMNIHVQFGFNHTVDSRYLKFDGTMENIRVNRSSTQEELRR